MLLAKEGPILTDTHTPKLPATQYSPETSLRDRHWYRAVFYILPFFLLYPLATPLLLLSAHLVGTEAPSASMNRPGMRTYSLYSNAAPCIVTLVYVKTGLASDLAELLVRLSLCQNGYLYEIYPGSGRRLPDVTAYMPFPEPFLRVRMANSSSFILYRTRPTAYPRHVRLPGPTTITEPNRKHCPIIRAVTK